MRGSFASDNHAGALPDVVEAVGAANHGHAPAYGNDDVTERLRDRFRDAFGPEAVGLPVFNGTGANVVALRAVARPYDAVMCAATAHLNVDECGAPERVGGFKLLPVDTPTASSPDLVAPGRARFGDEHAVQPRVVSITQSTEFGTVYEPVEIAALADRAHARGMLLHVDGARLANAAAALGSSLAAITTDAGVDVVSFGGDEERRPGRGGGGAAARRPGRRHPVHAQAVHAARLEDALHLRAARRAPDRRPLA